MPIQYDWSSTLKKAERLAPRLSGICQLAKALNIPRSTLSDAMEREGISLTFATDVDDVGSIQAITYAPKREKVVFLGDIHCPFQDDRSVDLVCELLYKLQPDEVCHLGDGTDFYAISNFDKDPQRAMQLQDELDVSIDVNTRLKSSCNAEFYYIERSNHEERWMRYLRSHPEIHGLRLLKLWNLMELDKIGWNRGGGMREYEHDLIAIHGSRYSKHSGWAVKKEMEDMAFQKHIVMGHNHKNGKYIRSGPTRTMRGWECGCLCQIPPTYKPVVNWQQTILVTTFINNDFYMDVIEIKKSGTRRIALGNI